MIPTTQKEVRVLQLLKQWKHTLKDHEINISTGPVVSFRLKENIVSRNEMDNYFPLIWMHHISKMKFDFEIHKQDKGQYMIKNKYSTPFLIENRNYIFLRRFSAKDDKHRLISTPYRKNYLPGKLLGVENKINYLYKINSELTETEAFGLSGLLNSTLFDLYFRTFNGNVNVSASELKVMSMPPYEDIMSIGKLMLAIQNPTMDEIDEVVGNVLNFKL